VTKQKSLDGYDGIPGHMRNLNKVFELIYQIQALPLHQNYSVPDLLVLGANVALEQVFQGPRVPFKSGREPGPCLWSNYYSRATPTVKRQQPLQNNESTTTAELQTADNAAQVESGKADKDEEEAKRLAAVDASVRAVEREGEHAARKHPNLDSSFSDPSPVAASLLEIDEERQPNRGGRYVDENGEDVDEDVASIRRRRDERRDEVEKHKKHMHHDGYHGVNYQSGIHTDIFSVADINKLTSTLANNSSSANNSANHCIGPLTHQSLVSRGILSPFGGGALASPQTPISCKPEFYLKTPLKNGLTNVL
jgi:hypothetical protein